MCNRKAVFVNNARAYRVYLVMTGLSAFFTQMVFTVTSIYRLQTVHLDAFQLVLVGTVLESTCFLFEVPTGVVADTFSRRLSVILGTLLLGAGIGLEGFVPSFAAVLLGQVISGIGYTFTSGATEAWVADEVGEEHLGRVFMRSGQVGQAGGLLGVIGGVVFGSISLNIPIMLGGSLLVGLGVLLMFVMPETGFKPAPREDRTTWQAMTHTLSRGVGTVRRQPRLVTFLVIASFLGMTSEGWDRLIEAHFLLNFQFPTVGGFQPVVWLGLMSMVGGFLSMGTMEIARRRIDMEHRASVVRSVTLFTALRVASVLVTALAGNFYIAVAGRWAKAIFQGVQGPIYRAWLNQSIDSRVRATVLSMESQSDALGQIVGGPVLGAVGNASLRAAIALSGLLLLPVLPLYGRAHRQSGPEIVVGDTSEATPALISVE